MKKRKRVAQRITSEDRAAFLAVINRPWEAWEREVEKRFKREDGITSSNDARQQQASINYQLYRDIAVQLYAEKPALRRATRHRLAQLIQAKLKEQGRVVSVRTIERAFPKK